ncbi:ankyrin [Bimuria novae-zelandiae CBS 107.79]|uniref:Ankyrin repeat domain-containing protein 54 n=1 Tax=Bimuria novae-zelandiae CBS 107.79 TaxID=1447943 RepID=A0A6A5UVL7_9PLEO|nr:ankyrin [Bimuria novae-zelandiae CBS 107.79]
MPNDGSETSPKESWKDNRTLTTGRNLPNPASSTEDRCDEQLITGQQYQRDCSVIMPFDFHPPSSYQYITIAAQIRDIAFMQKLLESQQLLLDNGADVNAVNDDGESPLHAAVYSDSDYEISRVLLSHGADIDIVDSAGRTALHNFYNSATRQLFLSQFDTAPHEHYPLHSVDKPFHPYRNQPSP